MVIEIRDPVSGYSYILDEQNKLAHRFAIQVPHTSDSAVRTEHMREKGRRASSRKAWKTMIGR